MWFCYMKTSHGAQSQNLVTLGKWKENHNGNVPLPLNTLAGAIKRPSLDVPGCEESDNDYIHVVVHKTEQLEIFVCHLPYIHTSIVDSQLSNDPGRIAILSVLTATSGIILSTTQ
jgi:hypothetical protein